MHFEKLIEKIKIDGKLTSKEWGRFHLELIKKRRLNKKEWKKEIKRIIKDTSEIERLTDNYIKKEEDYNKRPTEKKRETLMIEYVSVINFFIRGEVSLKSDKGTFKRAGHFADQMLKYNYPKDRQPDLFSGLKDTTIQKIEERGVERSEVIEGIKLSPSETKVIDCLCKLLHNKSHIYDKEDSNYYTGNKEASTVKYGEEAIDVAPRLGFTLYEFTQEYIGVDKKVGGKDIENVSNILLELSKKDFLIKYKEEEKHKGGGKTVRELEMFERIINLPTLRETKYDKKGLETSKKEETLVILHPIFRRQIDSKFILYPNDINKRTIIANGSPNVSDATIKLRDYLMRELSSKHYKPEIKQERLYYLLKEKWMNESRKKKVKEYTDKALETMIDLGLLESYKIEPAKTTGEPKVVFILNKNFE